MVVFIYLLVFSLTYGCSDKQSPIAESQRIKNFELQCNVIFDGYLHGDLDQARESLNKVIHMRQTNSVTYAAGKAESLGLEYARLYVLEMRTHNIAAAEAALIRYRYWILTRDELNGLSIDQTIDRFNKLTFDDFVLVVNKYDKDPNTGELPRYLESLKK